MAKNLRKNQGKIPVGILGATGMVGARFLSLLEKHPWFELVALAASRKSKGKKIGNFVILSVEDDLEEICKRCRVVFSAIDADKDLVKKIEENYAARGVVVVSNNSAHRWTSDVPMIIPEVNPDHLEMITIQRKNRGWKDGLIVTKPNCSIQSYVPLVKAWEAYEPKEIVVTTLQAVSGAGRTLRTWPEMEDNIIPFISGEEEKSEKEPAKVLGTVRGAKFVPNKIKISATCIRVPVSDGHMASISLKFKKKVSKEKLIQALRNFKNPLANLDLPSLPKPFVTYFEEENRPQTKQERGLGRGMGISAGRLREDKILGWKCVVLSHNTIRGAAGGSVLTAELLAKKGYIK